MYKVMNKLHLPPQPQSGFVSIIVALLLITLVSLMMLGFAFLTSQNRTQNQNRLLSTQAFYAAESGVNDAIEYAKGVAATNGGALPATSDIDNCNDLPVGYSRQPDTNIDQIRYTCVLTNSAPASLEATVSTDNSVVLRLESPSGNLQKVTIYWQESGGSDRFPPASITRPYLPTFSYLLNGEYGAGDYDLFTGTGMIRATLIPVYSTITRADVTNKSQTLFLYPRRSASADPSSTNFLTSASPGDANQGRTVFANCNPAASNTKLRKCAITIEGLDTTPGIAGTRVFYLRLKALYKSANIAVSAKADGVPGDTPLANSQLEIDSTGKASNVLRRIRVRVPIDSVGRGFPEYAIESFDSLCKRLEVWNTGAEVNSPATPTPTDCSPN